MIGWGWLPVGRYHYDRAGHHLSQVAADADRDHWLRHVPSMELVEGGAVLWVIVGDGGRMGRKYGGRAERFFLQEAGLMQNLCLVSQPSG